MSRVGSQQMLHDILCDVVESIWGRAVRGDFKRSGITYMEVMRVSNWLVVGRIGSW